MEADPLPFDPADPFGRAAGARPADYRAAQALSEHTDRWLGLETALTEQALSGSDARQPGTQLWIGLPVQAMLTPYSELLQILEDLAPAPGQTVIDLGAGYGRMGFVIARHYPEVHFVGYELAAPRVREGLRCFQNQGLSPSRIQLLHADISAASFTPPSADYYFIYDYGTRDAIQKTLEDLRTLASSRPITVVGRGRATRDTIERRHPWLSQVISPQHRGNYSIYRSA
jgi:hypothetical protein